MHIKQMVVIAAATETLVKLRSQDGFSANDRSRGKNGPVDNRNEPLIKRQGSKCVGRLRYAPCAWSAGCDPPIDRHPSITAESDSPSSRQQNQLFPRQAPSVPFQHRAFLRERRKIARYVGDRTAQNVNVKFDRDKSMVNGKSPWHGFMLRSVSETRRGVIRAGHSGRRRENGAVRRTRNPRALYFCRGQGPCGFKCCRCVPPHLVHSSGRNN